MKRTLLIVGAFTLWISLGSSCYLATEFIPVRNKCNSTYSYTDMQGNKGTSSRCFETEEGNMCKYKSKLIKVNRVVEKKVCE